MNENLPDVSHLRYRGERVEWRAFSVGGEYHLAAASNVAFHYIASVYDGATSWRGAVYASAESFDHVGYEIEDADISVVAKEAILRLLAAGVVTVVEAPASPAAVFSPELMALASAVAARQNVSLDDLLTRIVTTKVVSIAVVDYRDDPEIRRLHIDLAESWGKE